MKLTVLIRSSFSTQRNNPGQHFDAALATFFFDSSQNQFVIMHICSTTLV